MNNYLTVLTFGLEGFKKFLIASDILELLSNLFLNILRPFVKHDVASVVFRLLLTLFLILFLEF